MGNILIVDDDANIRKLLTLNLEKRGYGTTQAADGKQAISLFRETAFDLVLLDMVLPDMPAMEVCSWIRLRSEVPIIVISAVKEEDLMVKAFDAGAGDYITKPFGQAELLARVRAALRRTAGTDGEVHKESLKILEINDLLINIETRRVELKGEPVYLTKTEFALLLELATQPGVTLDAAGLLTRIWGPQYRDAVHYLHIYINRMRKKFGEHRDLLETISGEGYRLKAAAPGSGIKDQ